MTPDELWLAAVWPIVSDCLPPPPARVLEIGCGPLGGFVPKLRAGGYEAVGIDPEAPAGPWFRQTEFDSGSASDPVHAVVACTSLHHVADLPGTLAMIESALEPGGTVVVVEWARERFDAATANWCLSRLPKPDGDDWLRALLAEWQESGRPFEQCCRSWAEAEGLHTGSAIVAGLNSRFDTVQLSYGPYLFSDLADTSDADEQRAIDAGQIAATRIDYQGRKRASGPRE